MKVYDLNSKIKDIYEHPVGHDALSKILLQLGKSDKWLLNPVIGNAKLGTLSKLVGKKVGEDFFLVLLRLLNSETDVPSTYAGEIKPAWWKEAVFYQIYPRSFKDGNGDGIGDLLGIVSQLDYLKNLGVDALWLSPIYDSPNDDNGYDIRNYYEIMTDFGTMADFDLLLAEVHKRGMRLIMDLVVNHTSDEHPWFKEALADPHSKYRDYYFFKPNLNDQPPNNWTSFFSGSAWNYYPSSDEWALHLFSKKQMDLNWDNKDLRANVAKMVRWWLEKGVDGFRLDVINYISKFENLPEGNVTIGELMGYTGIENYFYGPNLHRYLHELKVNAFEPYGAFSVGETPGVGKQMSKLLTSEGRRELDMIFSFDHLETPGHVRWDDYQYDLNALKKYYIKWQKSYPNDCWTSLFYENHDNPRMISKINPNPVYRDVIGKLLAVIQLTMKGTPFIYQGQEIGSVNQNFTNIGQLKDVESINLYEELIAKTSEIEAFKTILAGSRDHARVPVQWSAKVYGGFSTHEPWLVGDDDYLTYNVDAQLKDEHSILRFYQEMIKLRKRYKSLVYGEIKFYREKEKNLFMYERQLDEETLLVICNLGSEDKKIHWQQAGASLLISNDQEAQDVLKPYEARVYLIG